MTFFILDILDISFSQPKQWSEQAHVWSVHKINTWPFCFFGSLPCISRLDVKKHNCTIKSRRPSHSTSSHFSTSSLNCCQFLSRKDGWIRLPKSGFFATAASLNEEMPYGGDHGDHYYQWHTMWIWDAKVCIETQNEHPCVAPFEECPGTGEVAGQPIAGQTWLDGLILLSNWTNIPTVVSDHLIDRFIPHRHLRPPRTAHYPKSSVKQPTVDLTISYPIKYWEYVEDSTTPSPWNGTFQASARESLQSSTWPGNGKHLRRPKDVNFAAHSAKIRMIVAPKIGTLMTRHTQISKHGSNKKEK